MTDVFMNTYHRLPVTFADGAGSWLVGTDGRRYLDFTAGIAVNCLGHGNPALVKAIADQAAKFNHVCNYYQSDVALAFAEKLVAACSAAGMQRVFLGNSGAEANEGACKIARKYSLKKYGPGRHQIVTLRGSFHGRTITTLAATGQDKFHRDFGPFTEGFLYAPGGDIDALDRALDRNTVAGLLIEAIQGESGIVPQDPAYIAAAAKLCADRDILLMFDEVQSGVGRTGTFLACEAYGVKPDVVTLAKGLSGGVPVGAVLAGEKAAEVFETGDHGSTFGGNPLAAAAGLVVLETVNNPAFLGEITRKGEKIMGDIKAWNHGATGEIRGKGLMIGMDIDGDAWPVLEKAVARASADTPGLLILSAGQKTLRFLPPYTISDAEIDQGLGMLKELL
jgi:acetylornithine/N-succinyldiaminopimelate aminotransferase